MDGAFLRQLRKSKHLTQQKLANMLNVDLSLIGKWELHNVTPNGDTLIELAKIFDVTTDALLGRNESAKSLDSFTPAAVQKLIEYGLVEDFQQLTDRLSKLPEQDVKTVVYTLNSLIEGIEKSKKNPPDKNPMD